jgi:hypothetical protein
VQNSVDLIGRSCQFCSLTAVNALELPGFARFRLLASLWLRTESEDDGLVWQILGEVHTSNTPVEVEGRRSEGHTSFREAENSTEYELNQTTSWAIEVAEYRFAKIRGLIRDIRGHFPCQSFMDYSSIGTTVNSRECGVVLAAMTGDGTSKSKSRSFGGHECFCGLMKCYFRACTTSWNAQINDEKLVFGDQRLVGSRALSVEIMNCLKKFRCFGQYCRLSAY